MSFWAIRSPFSLGMMAKMPPCPKERKEILKKQRVHLVDAANIVYWSLNDQHNIMDKVMSPSWLEERLNIIVKNLGHST